ncbi:alpha/beta hydrolase [Nocardia speluncae]|uniref:Alpha/beta hydrolase n=1 Tax=Nocardia speluncae TaxID=419477 RepID=A0A846XSA9_9NOCA|nr:alpha/beta hydrolase [Nocardia speluncae]NKY36474.1 alpha/beta hydrolase [Nocardia speluncae]
MREQWLPAPSGLRVCYTDFGGSGIPVLALHGTFGRGRIFAGLARELAGVVRIIALDQRGHGRTDRRESYTCDDFVADAAAVVERLRLAPVVVLGHSRGGITAYQLAARHPELVAGLIIEDVGPVMRQPEIADPVLPVRGWPAAAPTEADLAAALQARGIPDASYFLQSAVLAADGRCRFLFDWEDMMAVQLSGVGDWWADWLGSACPALVLRGEHSSMLPARLATRMAAQRPGTRLVDIAGAGHWVHDDAPRAMAAAISDFLADPAMGGGPGRVLRSPGG